MGKKTVLIAAAALCCSLLYCNNPADKESLNWYSTVDIPINLELRLWPDAESIQNSADNSVIVDMSKNSFTIEEVFLIKKLRNPTVSYKIDITNNYQNLDFVFYAIFAPKGEGLEDVNVEEMSIQDVYNLIKSEDGNEDRNCFSILGPDGFKVEAGKRDSTKIELPNQRLVHQVLNSPSISWRWLAKISQNDLGKFDDKQTIETRFRLRVRGISNLDSLLTF